MDSGFPAARPVRGRIRDRISSNTKRALALSLALCAVMTVLVWYWRLQPLALDVFGGGPIRTIDPAAADIQLRYQPDGEAGWMFTLENTSPFDLSVLSVDLADAPRIRAPLEFEHVTQEDGLTELPMSIPAGDSRGFDLRISYLRCQSVESQEEGFMIFPAPAHLIRYESLGIERTARIEVPDVEVWVPDRFGCSVA